MTVGVQLFTLREPMAADPGGTLKALSDAGYRTVETAGTYGLSPRAFAHMLSDNGLKAVAAHVGLADVEEGLDQSLDMAHALDVDWLVVPWVPEDVYRDGWARFGQRLSSAADAVLKRGLRLAYHNHDFEFKDEDGEPGFAHFWDAAEPSLEAELDLYWVHHAGYDPVDWMGRLAGRIPLAHFKDGKEGRHTPVGEGELDWRAIVESAHRVGVEHAIVELDECPRDPVECVVASLNYLKGLGLHP